MVLLFSEWNIDSVGRWLKLFLSSRSNYFSGLPRQDRTAGRAAASPYTSLNV
jgi:hypothetical protein